MLSDYETLVADLIRDDADRIALAEKDRAIQLAVQRYSKDRLREKVEDVATTAANLLPLPAGWEDEVSEVSSLEVPIGDVPPSILDNDGFGMYRDPSGLSVMLIDPLEVGTLVRVAYSIAHVVSAGEDTIPVPDREPVACWAAATLCDQLAAFYSGGTDSTIQADSVQSRSKAQEYSARAKALRTRYLNELGLEDKRDAAAGAVVKMTHADSRGLPLLTHPLRGARY